MAEGGTDEETTANISNYNALDALLKKRIIAWEYLQRVHLGATHWLNVTPVTAADLNEYFADASKTQRRCEEWLSLGASLASLLPIGVGFPFVAAVHQLWDEFEAHFNHLTQAEKRTRPIKLEYLILPNIPSALDYQLVFTTLLEVLIATYSRFLDPSMATQMSSEVNAVFLKLDGRFRHYIYDPAMKSLNSVALSIVTTQMASLGFERAALEATVAPRTEEPSPLQPSTSSTTVHTPSPLASNSFSSASFKPNKVKANSSQGRHRKDGDTHIFEDIVFVEDVSDTEGLLGSLSVNNDGVQLRGLNADVMSYPFKQIPRFRSDEKTGYFEFEYDKSGGGVGVHRVRSSQAHKIYAEIAATVERLVKARSAKK